MNHYRFEELTQGLTASFEREVTDDMMSAFKSLSGDENPLHVNAEAAARRGFSGPVVYGMLTASFLSTLVGMYLPGERALFHGLQIDFVKPVFVGDRLTVEGEITSLDERFSQIEIKASIRNQDGVKVCRGTLKAGVYADEV